MATIWPPQIAIFVASVSFQTLLEPPSACHVHLAGTHQVLDLLSVSPAPLGLFRILQQQQVVHYALLVKTPPLLDPRVPQHVNTHPHLIPLH